MSLCLLSGNGCVQQRAPLRSGFPQASGLLGAIEMYWVMALGSEGFAVSLACFWQAIYP